MTDPRTAAQLHEAGEFHNPASCQTCLSSFRRRATLGFDGARPRTERVDGPIPVTFTDPDGNITVVQAESVEWTHEPDAEPWVPREQWDLAAYHTTARGDLWKLLTEETSEEPRPAAIEAGPKPAASEAPERTALDELTDFIRGFLDGIAEGFAEAARPKPPTTGPPPRRSKNPRFH